ncbi:hypothetical protein [Homoserinibacter sp. GY 40078]|uniref:hypothetical protein n=1 Tax=Homoserinibacter sp. GY 40078 TaxID=2603275 RepID=UPI0011CA8288|nr:hypothetical protein [Homoserinibacter sp. GY 40078]TXK18592.1 hypothetical protein FVQ89_01165 [Homoserinibacter sp. GY 40078]
MTGCERASDPGATRPPIITSAVFSLAALALWLPILVWLASPDRDDPIGRPGELLIVGTVAIQILSIAVALFLHLVSTTWEATRPRILSALIAAAAALAWSWWAAISMLELPAGGIAVFVFAAVLLIAPALIPAARPGIRRGAAILAATSVLVASFALTLERLSPILIAPATVYVAAILLGSAPSALLRARSRRGTP